MPTHVLGTPMPTLPEVARIPAYTHELEVLDPVDRQILANIRQVAINECLIGYESETVYYPQELKDLLFAVAFALVAKPFGNDFARLSDERAARLRSSLLLAMALDITSIAHPETATVAEIKEALYHQTRAVAIGVMNQKLSSRN